MTLTRLPPLARGQPAGSVTLGKVVAATDSRGNDLAAHYRVFDGASGDGHIFVTAQVLKQLLLSEVGLVEVA